jgi:hypothetical protein
MRRVAITLLLLAACGGSEPGSSSGGLSSADCDSVVLGVCMKSLGPRYDPRYLERSLRLALQYWNAQEGALAGWRIVYGPTEIACGATTGASGCARWDVNVIELQALDPACHETAQLVHEIGHALHRDAGHQGSFWSWSGEQEATWQIVRSPGASPACAVSRYYVARPQL